MHFYHHVTMVSNIFELMIDIVLFYYITRCNECAKLKNSNVILQSVEYKNIRHTAKV